jgi:hypothetical protein
MHQKKKPHPCKRKTKNQKHLQNMQADPVVAPARIPKNLRASARESFSAGDFAEADYCISVRVWDVLLWFAIMKKPRRDVGICADFAHTLAGYSMQLLPRSIFPYPVVPTTRVESTLRPEYTSHVLMHTQFSDPKTQEDRIFRPAVIPRHHNPGIASANFKLQCCGEIGTKVLEDEMWMCEVIALGKDLGMAWKRIPLDMCPWLDIQWEYGVCFPMGRYFCTPGAGASIRKFSPFSCKVLRAPRCTRWLRCAADMRKLAFQVPVRHVTLP